MNSPEQPGSVALSAAAAADVGRAATTAAETRQHAPLLGNEDIYGENCFASVAGMRPTQNKLLCNQERINWNLL